MQILILMNHTDLHLKKFKSILVIALIRATVG